MPAISSTTVRRDTIAFFFASAEAPKAIVTDSTVGIAIGRPPTTSTKMLFNGAHSPSDTPVT
jgi:hypothetical protein